LAAEYLETKYKVENLLRAKRDLEDKLSEQARFGPFGGGGGSSTAGWSDSHVREWRELKSEKVSESLQHYNRGVPN